jgi:phage-related protein
MVREPTMFRGNSREDLRAFLRRLEAGFQLDRLQCGLEPDNWKPMRTIGAGVRKIRITDAAGAFQVMYVAKFASTLYVLHCFQKRTQRTRDSDIELAVRRYGELLRELRS